MLCSDPVGRALPPASFLMLALSPCVVQSEPSQVATAGSRELSIEPRRLMTVDFQTKRLDMSDIDERLRQNGIRIRLDSPLDGFSICVIKEALGDMMAEKGFTEAKVSHRTTSAVGAGGATVLKLTFQVTEGQRSTPPTAAARKARPSPSARCNR